MQRGSSFLWVLSVVLLCGLPAFSAASNPGSVSDLTEWDVTSYKVNLLDHRGGSGDIQSDQNNWIHLGANHLEGGDIRYEVHTGELNRFDILEVWIDGYSTSNDLNIGPTVFIGIGKNRFEQITRMNGDAWRPFVFRFGDDAVYGDITDPSNRNENWRIRYPSSKYEVRRIDKSPEDLLNRQILPIRISMTGAEDYIIKRIEVVVYRAKQGVPYRPLSIVKLDSYNVNYGQMVTLSLNQGLPSKDVDFYIIDPESREHRITPRVLNTARDQLAFYVEGYPFSKSGHHQIKLVDRSTPAQTYTAVEDFTVVTPKPFAPPSTASVAPNPPIYLPPIPEAPPTYIVPMPPPVPGVPPFAPAPAMMEPPAGTFPPSYSSGYTIQIGAYQAQASAVTVMNELRGYGYDAYISEAVQGGKRLFRVRVGKYPTKSLALQDADRLRSSGFDIWVTTLS